MKNDKDITVIIPVLDEADTVEKSVLSVHRDKPSGLDVEIIAVDGGSTDGSRETLERMLQAGKIDKLIHQRSAGKGGAVMEGVVEASGKCMAVFDADLEYKAADIFRVARPVIRGKADIGLGFRRRKRFGMRRNPRLPEWPAAVFFDLGTFILERLIRMVSRTKFRDPFCMHRCWTKKILHELPTGTDGFGWDLDMLLTAYLNGRKIIETPVSYFSRTFHQGKKLRPVRDTRDNLRVLFYHRGKLKDGRRKACD